MSERLKEVADRWMEEVWRERNLDAIDELHAPHYQDRSLPDHSPGPGPYKASVAELFAAFPDFYAIAEDLVIDDAGKVAVLWTATGAHR